VTLEIQEVLAVAIGRSFVNVLSDRDSDDDRSA
jgi:hypothetical protein